MRTTIAAVVIGMAGSMIGLFASYHLNTPTAATIILIHCLGFATSVAFSRLRR